MNKRRRAAAAAAAIMMIPIFIPPLCGSSMTQSELKRPRLSSIFFFFIKESGNNLDALCIFYASKIRSHEQVSYFRAQPLLPVKGQAGFDQTANKLKQTAEGE